MLTFGIIYLQLIKRTIVFRGVISSPHAGLPQPVSKEMQIVSKDWQLGEIWTTKHVTLKSVIHFSTNHQHDFLFRHVHLFRKQVLQMHFCSVICNQLWGNYWIFYLQQSATIATDNIADHRAYNLGGMERSKHVVCTVSLYCARKNIFPFIS